MIKDTLARLEALIGLIKTSDAQKKGELLGLLDKLKAEVARLEASHEDEARSLMGFAEAAAHEATRRRRDPALLKHSTEGLSASVKAFEVSHPQLTAAANALAAFLSNLGI